MPETKLDHTFVGQWYEYRITATTTVEGFPDLDHIISGDNLALVEDRVIRYLKSPSLRGVVGPDLAVQSRTTTYHAYSHQLPARDWIERSQNQPEEGNPGREPVDAP